MVNANIISIQRAKALGVIVTGRNEFVYDYCKDCSLQYDIQLSLFDYA